MPADVRSPWRALRRLDRQHVLMGVMLLAIIAVLALTRVQQRRPPPLPPGPLHHLIEQPAGTAPRRG